MQQEDELLELSLVAGQRLGVEPLEGLLVGSFVIEPGLPDVRDDDPVAAEVDRIVERLVDRRDVPAREGTVERVLRPLPLDGREVALRVRTKLAEDRVGELPVGLDVLLPGERVPLGVVDRPGIAQQLAEDVVEEIAEDLLFLMGVDGPGGDHPGPSLQLGAPPDDWRGQAEAQDGQAQDVGAKDRLGLNRHGGNPQPASASMGTVRSAVHHSMPPRIRRSSGR
jgi:hypothetical protein